MIGRDGQYHVSRWPPGWRSDRRRVPAILTKIDQSWHIVDLNGQTWPVASHADVLAVAARPYAEETSKPTKLDIFVTKLPHYPWLEEAMVYDGTIAYARGRHRIGGLICSYGRLKLRIDEAAAWGSESADVGFLRNLVNLYALCNVGAYATPGALGMSIMETSYLAAGYERQSRPSGALRSALLANRIGGRSDWTESTEVYDQVWEADQRNAYCSAAALPLPVGSVTRFLKGEVETSDETYQTWYAECECFNAAATRNAPVLSRSATGRLVPFIRQGHQKCYLWREESEAFAARPGCHVIVGDGWGWRKMEPVLRGWAETMHAARAKAAKVSPDLEQMVKLCIVAAIGRHGCRPERRSVIPIQDATEGDAVLTDTLDGQWATHTEDEMDAPWITYWHDYIVMRIRLMNYQLQVQEAERDNVALGSNIDSVYFLNKPAALHQPNVLGGWRIRDKHRVSFPFARGMLSDEKVSLPGVPKTSEKRRELVNA